LRDFLSIALDFILVAVVLECVALWWAGKRRLHQRSVREWLPNLAAGFFLMLAIRMTLAERYDIVLALVLPASLVAHLLDLRSRLKQG
jgi:hypothetical protein